jgi:hypothetical protein
MTDIIVEIDNDDPIVIVVGAGGVPGTPGTQGGTLTGELNLGENTGLVLDESLSLDGKYSGIIEGGVAGTSLVFGNLCSKSGATGKWVLADAGVITAISGDCRGSLGICVLAANNNQDTKMLLWGKIRSALFPVFSVNPTLQLFISETSGEITEAIPTSLDHAIRCVGWALTVDDLFFNPSPDYVTRIV